MPTEMLNDGSRHIESCQVNFAAMLFDKEHCLRCKKCWLVVQLRRKSRGGTEEEADSALTVANRIMDQFKLTRGEVYDREFEVVVPTQTEYKSEEYRYTPPGRRPSGKRFKVKDTAAYVDSVETLG